MIPGQLKNVNKTLLNLNLKFGSPSSCAHIYIKITVSIFSKLKIVLGIASTPFSKPGRFYILPYHIKSFIQVPMCALQC